MQESSVGAAPQNAAWSYTAPYVAPFLVLMALLALSGLFPLDLSYLVRTTGVAAALLVFSRPLLGPCASRPVQSVLIGLAVFALWIGPDLLWPGYHQHWLFRNPVTGSPGLTAHGLAGQSALLLWLRAAGSVLVVPPAEELFWRGWLMRRLIADRFDQVPLGAFSRKPFAITALVFAAEHGPYWDVGLLAGIVYGFWMVRTRRLADCILAHAVTNAALAAYVIIGGRWEFWL